MGDRANVRMDFVGEDGGNRTQQSIWLYTHWDGSELPEMLKDALRKGQPRWGDDSYLCRIIVSQIVGEAWQGETGYGLAPYRGDYEYPDLIVNLPDQTVVDRKGTLHAFADYVARRD
jgi:DNA anti-recombination protein RmuC